MFEMFSMLPIVCDPELQCVAICNFEMSSVFQLCLRCPVCYICILCSVCFQLCVSDVQYFANCIITTCVFVVSSV